MHIKTLVPGTATNFIPKEFTTASPPHAQSATMPKPTSSINGAHFILQKNNPANDLSRLNR